MSWDKPFREPIELRKRSQWGKPGLNWQMSCAN